jgi:hypothetical protein
VPRGKTSSAERKNGLLCFARNDGYWSREGAHSSLPATNAERLCKEAKRRSNPSRHGTKEMNGLLTSGTGAC